MACSVGGAAAVPNRQSRRQAAAQVRARHVPVPVRRPAHGPRRGVRARRHRRPLLAPAGLQRAAPDRLGLVRPAGRERGDQARDRPARLDLRQHRAAEEKHEALCGILRLVARTAHERPRVLQVEPVAVPASSTRRASPTARRAGSTGTRWTRPCSPTSRCSPDGTSDRSGAVVVKKKLTQWYFKITDYADRLLDDLNQLEGSWPPKVLAMQRNWIGRSIGADVDFVIEGRDEKVTVFTTRPDTLYGATFMVVAPDSDLAAELVAGSTPELRQPFQAYLEPVQKTTEIERQDATREKTGVFARALRDQPGERGAHADLGGGLRARRLRSRRGHGRAGARPARPRLRAQVRPAGARGRRHERPGHRHHPGNPGQPGDRRGRAAG